MWSKIYNSTLYDDMQIITTMKSPCKFKILQQGIKIWKVFLWGKVSNTFDISISLFSETQIKSFLHAIMFNSPVPWQINCCIQNYSSTKNISLNNSNSLCNDSNKHIPNSYIYLLDNLWLSNTKTPVAMPMMCSSAAVPSVFSFLSATGDCLPLSKLSPFNNSGTVSGETVPFFPDSLLLLLLRSLSFCSFVASRILLSSSKRFSNSSVSRIRSAVESTLSVKIK